MRRWLILFFAVLLPLQFAWSAVSAYCRHETGEAQSRHVGHHAHAHHGETTTSSVSGTTGDPDCASCHATGVPALAGDHGLPDLSTASASVAPARVLPYASALARAPDRPQWRRPV